MDTPYKKVPVTYGNDCVANQAYAACSVTHVSEGPQDFVIYDHAAQDDRYDYFELYDWQPVGTTRSTLKVRTPQSTTRRCTRMPLPRRSSWAPGWRFR